MPYKCCVPRCKSNYLTEEREKGKVSVYRFPPDEEEKLKWIKAIPRANLTVSNNTRVCRYRWPADCAIFILSRGKERATEPPPPPFIFDDIPASCLSSLPPKPRKTILASCSSRRNIIPDELKRFREEGKLLFSVITHKVKCKEDVKVFKRAFEIGIQSKYYYSVYLNF